MCNEFGTQLLGEVPVRTEVRVSGDEGTPLAAGKTSEDTAKIFEDISAKLAKAVAKYNAARSSNPDTVIEF